MTVLAIPLGLYFIFLLINSQDEALSEQSKRNLAQIAESDRALSQNLNNNAYVFALGFDVPKEDSPITEGLKRLQQLQSLTVMEKANAKQTASYELPQLPLENCLSQDDFLMACKASLKQENKLKMLLAENRWLIERYQQLLDMSNWQDSTHYNAFINSLPFRSLLAAQKLYFLDVYQNKSSAAPSMTAQAIEQDMMFWQRLSANTHILSSKVLSAGAMSVNMKLGEIMINQLAPEQETVAIPESWQRPMSPQVLSLNNAKLGEWHYFTKITEATQVVDSTTDIAIQAVEFLMLPLMQPQDTANRYAAILLGSKPLEDCQIGLSIDTISQYIFNPIGKIILCSGIPSFESYQASLDSLEQHRASLVLRLEQETTDTN
ncbi:hypothetical protein MK852_12250 [Shewanella benthica]|uniref:hypothetical protein n=1 Tax=Shewanella benthica TaxID=43661 RepID=UPI001D0D4CF1|nr:hypothetical protein [Shewanella benthica]MCL1062899.1 hypothetical protein [Shewanella benthica]